ncbi:can [Scenedesmus sp. PABB004]|nr:can [Scenedesmus sp. PABB004]
MASCPPACGACCDHPDRHADGLAGLLAANRSWAASMRAADAEYFTRLAAQQSPEYLWIGCSDSRVPANQILDMSPGEIFVQRNVGNQAMHTDMNLMSCLEYAVKALKVKTIILCGHYNCGAVKAALQLPHATPGLVNCWISDIRECRNQAEDELRGLDPEQQLARLCELNVLRQLFHVATSPVVAGAWGEGQELHLYGTIYDVSDGHLRKLAGPISSDNGYDHSLEGFVSGGLTVTRCPATNRLRVSTTEEPSDGASPPASNGGGCRAFASSGGASDGSAAAEAGDASLRSSSGVLLPLLSGDLMSSINNINLAESLAKHKHWAVPRSPTAAGAGASSAALGAASPRRSATAAARAGATAARVFAAMAPRRDLVALTLLAAAAAAAAAADPAAAADASSAGAGAAAALAAARSPIFIFPGILGSGITGTPSANSPALAAACPAIAASGATQSLWAPSLLLLGSRSCWYYLFRLRAAPGGGFADAEGVTAAVDPGGASGTEFDIWARANYGKLAAAIAKGLPGYVVGENLFGAPYDFRWDAAGLADTGRLDALADRVAAAVRANGGRKAVLVGHSMGGLVALTMLRHPRFEAWRAANVQGYLALAAPLGGAVTATAMRVSGYNFGFSVAAATAPVVAAAAAAGQPVAASDFFRESLYQLSAGQPSVGMLMPYAAAFGSDRAGAFDAVHTADKLTAAGPLPGIQSACVFGRSVDTPLRYRYAADIVPGKLSGEPLAAGGAVGRGDGTVNIESLRLCSKCGAAAARRLRGAAAGRRADGAARGRGRARGRAGPRGARAGRPPAAHAPAAPPPRRRRLLGKNPPAGRLVQLGSGVTHTSLLTNAAAQRAIVRALEQLTA